MKDELIEQAARVICELEYGDPDDPVLEYDDCGRVATYEFAWTYYVGHAQALADAGLLARPLPDRDETARALFIESDRSNAPTMARAWDAPGGAGRQRWWDYADAVLELLKGKNR